MPASKSKTPRVPTYRRHPNGTAFLYHKLVPTKDHRLSLGKHGSAESKARYRQFLLRLELLEADQAATFAASPIAIDAASTLAELALAYDVHAKEYYRRRDELTGEAYLDREYRDMKYVVDLLLKFSATNPPADLLAVAPGTLIDEIASTFGPKRFKEFRLWLVEQDYARTHINRILTRVRSFFGWACAEELIEPAIYERLGCVKGLNPGQFGVRESVKKKAVTLAALELLTPYLPPVVADMAMVQFMCGMRPCEACRMRPCDIDQSSDIWIFTPYRHKTAWRGKVLEKAIPKAAQRILAPHLAGRAAKTFIFSPADTAEWVKLKQLAERPERKTKRYPSEARRVAREKQLAKRRVRKRKPSPSYSTRSYWRALRDAYVDASAAGVECVRISPNQLRRGILTFISSKWGEQKAQRYAGHDRLETTGIYTETERAEIVSTARQLDAAWAAAGMS